MIGGFTFCGVDIAYLGLEYAPELENTYVYRPTTAETHEQTFDGHDGGYYYGQTKQPKEFILRCYFENEAIDRGIMTKIYNTFKIGKSGKLIFKRKPWCYYFATVTNSPAPELSNYLNGLFTITMKAYYPFGQCDSMLTLRAHTEDITETDKGFFDVLANTALFDEQKYIDSLPVSFDNINSTTTILLPNPGTEPAPVCICVKGDVGEGVSINNTTTNQHCEIVNLSSSDQSSDSYNKYLLIDAMNGKVLAANMNEYGNFINESFAFKFHNKGFIYLEPSYPAIRNIFATFEGDTVHTTNIITEDVCGKYIFTGTNWIQIIDQPDNQTLTLLKPAFSNKCKTMIMLLNEIAVVGTSFNLSYLNFIYKPTFS